jgi:hypothetical protein
MMKLKKHQQMDKVLVKVVAVILRNARMNWGQVHTNATTLQTNNQSINSNTNKIHHHRKTSNKYQAQGLTMFNQSRV